MQRCRTQLVSPLLIAVMAVAPWTAEAIEPTPPTTDQAGMRLLMFLVVDQMTAEQLTDLRPHFQGGLRRLLDGAVEFTEAHHAHAVTVTANGHASLATGAHPARHGIIDNQWYDRREEKVVYCVADDDAQLIPPDDKTTYPSNSGRSPANMLVDGIGDWVKRLDTAALAFSISGKDRSAILLAGKKPDAAYWYDHQTGHFITSAYYRLDYPPWLVDFMLENHPDRKFPLVWRPLPVEPAIRDVFGLRPLDTGTFRWSFPHRIGNMSLAPNESYYNDFIAQPGMDQQMVDLALALVENEVLGRDASLDYLAVSFATLDYVGHDYGPHSPEVLDVLLRLDVALGRLLDGLDALVGLDHIVFTLSSDHGVQVVPEADPSGRTQRADSDDVLCVQSVGKALVERFGDEDWFVADGYLDYQAIGRTNLRRQDVEAEVARRLERCPAVARVWSRTGLTSKHQPDLPAEVAYHRKLFNNNFHRQRSGDVFVQLKENYLGRLDWGTTHGSPYGHDTHVPMLIVHPQVQPQKIAIRVATVDLAPTLAAMLGLDIPDERDGIDRSPLFSFRAPPAGR